MKKLLVVFVMLLLSTAMFVACAPNPPAQQPAAEQAADEAAVENAIEEETEAAAEAEGVVTN